MRCPYSDISGSVLCPGWRLLMWCSSSSSLSFPDNTYLIASQLFDQVGKKNPGHYTNLDHWIITLSPRITRYSKMADQTEPELISANVLPDDMISLQHIDYCQCLSAQRRI
ncbi:hypothetical protein CEXT_807191 [Caerostris extrusa]|uniref:Uncharacterized protein n=1 Tax=Caerostris extrusa TaxID=172846 RepID=A0AAV4S113_CAEEX|nr:hypothetical protein CEXT_807191 [Caerostris extrusa]